MRQDYPPWILTQYFLVLGNMLLYFEHWGFLALDKLLSYYNKDTWNNQNKVIIERNIVFHFTHQVHLGKQYNLDRTSSLNR